jgi:hypothetical protein
MMVKDGKETMAKELVARTLLLFYPFKDFFFITIIF